MQPPRLQAAAHADWYHCCSAQKTSLEHACKKRLITQPFQQQQQRKLIKELWCVPPFIMFGGDWHHLLFPSCINKCRLVLARTFPLHCAFLHVATMKTLPHQTSHLFIAFPGKCGKWQCPQLQAVIFCLSDWALLVDKGLKYFWIFIKHTKFSVINDQKKLKWWIFLCATFFNAWKLWFWVLFYMHNAHF